ncbi:hypothetical protein SEA_GATOR_42 [Mycobacterium phage Gator]|nr:hypothetical protein SEA_GLEXAN_42 [Mycobacterium phage Glexan]QDH91917.1 hypothetical protein SEA_FLYPOTENUSE_39 [Mycobacterium phage Flypotenuse]QDK01776.1 hypothetical protein SEA_GATOR_42 [Mycobacterium phage Gator]QPL14777.1 hypothetical protein SEA_HARELLA_44 [Mycobacterium phage Harella]
MSGELWAALTERCAHRVVIKRPESGPGASGDPLPGEWFCNDCPQWWDTYEDVLVAAGEEA